MAFIFDQPPGHAHYEAGAVRQADLASEGFSEGGVGAEMVLVDAVKDDVDAAGWDLVHISEHVAGAVADGHVVGVALEEADLV